MAWARALRTPGAGRVGGLCFALLVPAGAARAAPTAKPVPAPVSADDVLAEEAARQDVREAQVSKYRALLNPLLSPKRMAAMEPFVKEKATSLIEGLKARGASCEVMTEFAFPLAVSVLQEALASANDAIKQLSPEAQRTLGDLRATLQSAQGTLGSLERNLAQPDAPLMRNANDTITEIQRAARALRQLSDYLQQHPESLLRGKPPDPDVNR